MPSSSRRCRGCEPPSDWQLVSAIPGADDGLVPVDIWTGEPGVVYVMARQTGDAHRATLYRWDGEWTTELDMPDWYASEVHGTAPDDIYASMYTCLDGTTWSCSGSAVQAKIFHFDGTAWAEEVLPPAMQTSRLNVLGGVPGEVHVGGDRYIARHTDAHGWQIVYDGGTGRTVWPGTMTFLSADEAYVTSCWGHAKWDGTTWTRKVEFDFCDEADIWGARDDAGELHLWVTGNNNFQNGIRIWKYDEAAQSFGSKYGFEFGDPATPYGSYRAGSGLAIWGAAWDDVYATGYRWNPYPTDVDTRIFHNDGTGWAPLDLPDWMLEDRPTDLWGTATDDVWFVLLDGSLVHLGPPDSDGDGILDDFDLCPDTVIPDPTIPIVEQRPNRWALVDDDGDFDALNRRMEPKKFAYSLTDTGGCNAEQIATALELGGGHWKYGISTTAMEAWVNWVSGS